MKTPALLFFAFLTISIAVTSCNRYGNSAIDCKAILNQKMYLAEPHDKLDQDSVFNDYNILSQCGNLDSIDCEVFRGSVLGMILTDDMKKKGYPQPITYQKCLDLIAQFKVNRKEDYLFFYKGILVRKEIEKLSVKPEEFDSLRPKFKQTGMTERDIDEFKTFLEKEQREWTYKEAIPIFFNSQPLEFPKLDNIEETLNKAKKSGLNCLIYFSAHTDKAREFERAVLTDPEIVPIIKENYIYQVAFADDKTKLENGSGTIGEANAKLQKERFHSDRQPMLYILSPDGKIISTWDNKDDFYFFRNFIKQEEYR